MRTKRGVGLCALLGALCVTACGVDARTERFDASVEEPLDVNGRWQMVHRTEGNCPRMLLAHPFEGLTEWSLDDQRLEVLQPNSGRAMALDAVSRSSFAYGARVEALGCFLEERLQLDVHRFEPTMMEGDFEFHYRRDPADACDLGEESLPVECRQTLSWQALRR